MKVYMIGHASILVETKDSRILVDPVLFSSINQEVEAVFPERKVIHELIPKIDLLIISHWHSDHYDPRSLASLPKNIDVIIPKDKILEKCLQKLGYSQIYALEDFDEIRIGSTSIITTRSENRVPEFGIIFSDSSGVFWNQVDSIVSFDTIAHIKSIYPKIDFLLASWQPMLESQYQYNEEITFPYSSYSKLLTNISMINPNAIAPGANGFKRINSASWMNGILFPVTREQFCKDVEIIIPKLKSNVFELDPGDILAINNGLSQLTEEKSNFVIKSQISREELDFSPVNLDSKMIDDSKGYDIEIIKNEINNIFLPRFSTFIIENKNSTFSKHFYWQVTYQLEVVFSEFSLKWSFDFNDKNVDFKAGRNPCSNLFTVITASSLYGLIKKWISCEYVALSGSHRCFQKIYRATTHGVIKPENKIEDPLILYFPGKGIFEEFQYREVEKWRCNDEDLESSNSTDTKIRMIKLGNTLIRCK